MAIAVILVVAGIIVMRHNIKNNVEIGVTLRRDFGINRKFKK